MSTMNVSLQRFFSAGNHRPKQLFIAGTFVVALIAFELFNFDTTRFALENLLGSVLFLGIGWATILAIAFCGIDLAGLVRLFTPQQGKDEPKEVWYLMGAWLLGATMNAVMTWWAVSLTLLNNNFGNEVLSREQLLRYVPIFVAVLVWLTRILFIGSISMAGDHLFAQRAVRSPRSASPSANTNKRQRGRKSQPTPVRSSGRNARSATSLPKATPSVSAQPPASSRQALSNSPPKPQRSAVPLSGSRRSNNARVKQRPPRPGMRPASTSTSARMSP